MFWKYFELYRTIFSFYLVLAIYLKLPIHISGYLWLSLAILGYLRLSCAIQRHRLAISGYPWLPLAKSWYFILSCAISGHLWLYRAISIKYLVSRGRQKRERASYGYLNLFGSIFLFSEKSYRGAWVQKVWSKSGQYQRRYC